MASPDSATAGPSFRTGATRSGAWRWPCGLLRSPLANGPTDPFPTGNDSGGSCRGAGCPEHARQPHPHRLGKDQHSHSMMSAASSVATMLAAASTYAATREVATGMQWSPPGRSHQRGSCSATCGWRYGGPPRRWWSSGKRRVESPSGGTGSATPATSASMASEPMHRPRPLRFACSSR